MKILTFTQNGTQENIVTDELPVFGFSYEGEELSFAEIDINGRKFNALSQVAVRPQGLSLSPFTEYKSVLTVKDGKGNSDKKTLCFSTGRLKTPWVGKWITDGQYKFKEKKVSPVPLTFKKDFDFEKPVKSAVIYSTAIGIYGLYLNGSRVGEDYFAPGFTTYKSQLQYQTYDVTQSVRQNNSLTAVVAGGWAVGSFIFTRNNRITADRQALLLELRVTFEDNTERVISTDESWRVTRDGAYKLADFYDGEIYDATVDYDKIVWRAASLEKVKIKPEIVAQYGLPVTRHEKFLPVSVSKLGDEIIYDFGQNFAGVVEIELKGSAGQVITVRHAEILNKDGSLNTTFLRTAKATATYICKDGNQTYSPAFTYMGFRYASVKGVDEKDIKICAYALYSSVTQNGSFTCSNELLNKLNQNIVWSAKSNFVDIPTDCPQRDERMGWTGDIAVFAQTACYNFDTSRFFYKWLKDMRAEQHGNGSLPNTIPSQGYGFPTTMPTVIPVDFWGDACVLVPWAEYKARGDSEILRKNYPMMQKYFKACKFWANIWGVGKYRYIWHTPAMFHFGDWVAPDVPKMSQWQARSKWTATASLKNVSCLLSRIAEILGKKDDAKKYLKISKKVSKAYLDVFTDGNGKLKNEFQTAYVLPLYFDMFEGAAREKAAENLEKLIIKNNYRIGTGFPGTPYILFALADNGKAETAFKTLLNTECPSWLYEVKIGATTVWERWDGLDENGQCPIGNDGTGGMISFNHYAFGAVGDFLYRRIAGIEPTSGGYKTFRIAPLLGGGITFAKGEVNTPYGLISSDWKLDGNNFVLRVKVPCGTVATIVLPDGKVSEVCGGEYEFTATPEKITK